VHVSRLTLAVSLLAALATASAAGARSNFNGNVCRLASAKQVTAIAGVSSNCTNARPSKGPGSTIYAGDWAGKTSRSPRVQVTVAFYTDLGVLQLAKSNLKQGLPGKPRKVAGIGSAAYEATGGLSTGIHFNVGKYVVYLTLNAVGKPPRSTPPLEALAKAIAARL
jgi:hypothetical protein